jgi:hypothetical protein
LIGDHRDKLFPWSGLSLCEFISSTGSPSFPSLLRHFDVIIVNEVPDSYPGRLHPDDAVIELRSVTQYSMAEIGASVELALRSKDHCNSDMLILHTIRADHKSYFPGTAMHAREIVTIGRQLVPWL